MGLLSDFFIADADDSPEYDCGPDFPDENRCQFKWITPLEAAGILFVLRGEGDRIQMMNEFPLLTPEDADELTFRIPDEMVSSLAALTEEQIPEVGRKCAEATAEELKWTAEGFARVINELSALARRAAESNRAMYLWNSL